jgi:alcohol dehydrogenase class IV
VEGCQAIRRCHGRDLQGLQVLPSLADVGITGGSEKLAEDAMKQSRLLVNKPREVRYDDALAIYTEAFGNWAAA